MTIKIQKLHLCINQLGISRSTFLSQVNGGLVTKPVKVGLRAVGWPSNEIEEILEARIAGNSYEEIKELVVKLENERKNKVRVVNTNNLIQSEALEPKFKFARRNSYVTNKGSKEETSHE
jgi:prophage regulatory protein